MTDSSGIKVCSTRAAAEAFGDMYRVVHRPVERGGGWFAIPKHPSNQLLVDQLSATWGLDAPSSATARASDPATSHEAAQRASHTELSDRLLCLRAHVYAGARGLNGDELELATGRDYESLGPRRRPLEIDGLLAKATTAAGKPLRRNNKNVYVATPDGIEAWRRAAEQRGAA